MTDIDIELTRSESDLAREETTLQTELDRLEVSRAELLTRQQALKRKLHEAKASGAVDAALEQKLHAVALDAPDAEATRAAARAKRKEAIVVRQRAHTELKSLVGAWQKSLQAAGAQLSAHDVSVRALADQGALEAQARQAAAIRDSELRVTAQTVTARPSAMASPAPVRAGRAARLERRVPMQAAIDLSSQHNFFSGFSANLSDGGVFVATVNLMPLGTEVDLKFTLPTGETIEAHGVVRWVREVNDGDPEQFPGMGVQFVSLPKDAEDSIHRFVQEREPLFFAAA